MILEHRQLVAATGQLAAVRSRQALDWMRELVSAGLEEQFRQDDRVAGSLPELERAVAERRVTPFAASRKLLGLFRANQ